MIKKHLWSKPFEYGLNEIDVKILNVLCTDLKFLKPDFTNISKRTGMTPTEVRRKIKELKNKKIILKERISLIDILKVWDLYLFTFVKTKLETPVEGLEIKTPIGWTGIMRALIAARNKFDTNTIRQAFTLHGTEWDLFLLRSLNNQVDAEEFLEFIVEEGWVEAGWSGRPSEGTRYIFDPIGVPNIKEYKEKVETPLKSGGAIWKKAIENELDEKDVQLLNLLCKDSGFSDTDYERIANIAGVSEKTARERIRKLKLKGIILRERISCLDIFELWDSYFITFIKARDHEKIFSEIERRSRQTGIVRQAFLTWAGGWDIVLFTTVNSVSDLVDFINPILKRHPNARTWTVKQQDIDEKIFDPIAVPTVDDYKESVEAVLRDYRQSWGECI